jgi:hypothetical protein
LELGFYIEMATELSRESDPHCHRSFSSKKTRDTRAANGEMMLQNNGELSRKRALADVVSPVAIEWSP